MGDVYKLKAQIHNSDSAMSKEIDSFFARHDHKEAVRLRNKLPKDITASDLGETIRVQKNNGITFSEQRENQYVLLIRLSEIVNNIEISQKKGEPISQELIKEIYDLIWLLDGVHYDTANLYSIIGKIASIEAKKRLANINPLDITDDEIKYIEILLRKANDGGIHIDTEYKKFHLMVTKKRVNKVMGEGMPIN